MFTGIVEEMGKIISATPEKLTIQAQKVLEGTVLELGSAVHAHPSLSEMLKEAALGAQGRTIHM